MLNIIDNISIFLKDASLLSFPAAYLGGILISFSPCVYPVAPITIAFIGAQSTGSRWKGFFLSLAFVLGLSFTYTFLGLIAALSGKLFGQIQANPWTHILLANIFILMGLSLMGVFSLPLRTPGFAVKMQRFERMKGAIGSFIVGAASGLVVGPCTAPALAVLLSYVAANQSVVLGAILLFVFSLGMGTLLILLGTFAGFLSCLPKSGKWMLRINRLSGLILFAMGEYFLVSAGLLW